MENKTKIRDGFKAWWETLKTFMSKQEDNKLLSDLNIVKGICAGFGYVIYLSFVLPAKIFTFLLNPSWTWIHFAQRHLVSPIFEVEALTGSESPSRILGEIYENNLNYFKTTSDSGVNTSTLKPSISILERIMIFAKVRVVITLLFFVVGAFAMYEAIEAFLEIAGLIFVAVSGLVGYSGMSVSSNGSLFGGLVAGFTIKYILYFIGSLLIAYMMMFALRFVMQSFKSIMYADKKMLKDFVDDSLHYTITKSIELYGEDIALKAYDLLLENVVTEQERYTSDEPYYKRLEKPKVEPLKLNDSKEA